MARKKSRGRDISGILLLDKPGGISSNKALQIASAIFNARKAGHTGSLDPLATGMLPICFGEATKVSGFMLSADKVYTVSAKLGVVTDTGDSDGEVIQTRDASQIDLASLTTAVEKFRGNIAQVPPMYSALKRDGQPLYKLARAGKEVAREPREVHVSQLRILEFADATFSLSVHCSKGTYIRSLVTDIGETLGCGAHVIALRRDWVAPFGEATMHILDELRDLSERDPDQLDTLLLDVESALSFERINLLPPDVDKLLNGQSVTVPQAIEVNAPYILKCARSERFLGIGVGKSGSCVAPKRLVNTEAREQNRGLNPSKFD
ncbi:MAG: tRNA pseudouridine(55) synthase TruB [Pseudomonadota bacterium]